MTLVDVIHDGCGARFEINIKDLKNYSGDRFARTTDGKCPVCHHYSKQYQLTVIRVNELRNQYATKIHNQ